MFEIFLLQFIIGSFIWTMWDVNLREDGEEDEPRKVSYGLCGM